MNKYKATILLVFIFTLANIPRIYTDSCEEKEQWYNLME